MYRGGEVFRRKNPYPGGMPWASGHMQRLWCGNILCQGTDVCAAFGAAVTYARELMHGKQSEVAVDGKCRLFHGLPEKIKAARYHSLAVREETIPEELLITARTEDGEVMAVSHRKYQVYGVQFHPESILTPDGETIIRNFLGMALLEKSK